jgi:CDP-6-deoxy-D-xylo-4-hexulose-3-dehydrase
MDATLAKTSLDWPLMRNNITREDLDAVTELLQQDDPILTQSRHVRAFEEEWSQWLGVRHSVFVNSGSSANLVTMAALRALYGGGEIIVPTVTWVSDIAAVLHNGFEPVFVDIDMRTLGMDNREVIARFTPKTRAVFLTHVLGYNALTQELLDELYRRKISLIEDVCEAPGAVFQGRKLGTYGLAANFSFYYAHHLSTVEGGMVSTNNTDFYEAIRMLRGHGLVRELASESRKREYADEFSDLHPDFIFATPGYNVRNTEINAVIGRSQLQRFDATIPKRTENLQLFLKNLDPEFFFTEFAVEGSSNYALTLVLRRPDQMLFRCIMRALQEWKVEFRRGTAGGGNQLRQPYLRRILSSEAWRGFPHADHVHFFGLYIGNYPYLEQDKILQLCDRLNHLCRSFSA